MIPLQLMPEPKNFDQDVRQKGADFLKKIPNPTSKDFSGKDFWKKIALELHSSYKAICAYSCISLPTVPGAVDHFLPKSKYPNLAYEWNNYRLCLDKINQYKGSSENICDPFTVQMGWFVIDFPSCLVKPGENLDKDTMKKIENTIKVLKLNTDEGLVDNRLGIIMDLIEGHVDMNFIERRFPFVALEIKRQGIEGNIENIFKKIDF
ncbi:hypothetical protein [Photorhabdus sp. RM323S]|uniref:hypothetical protein n=1 Tax=Photorhabdus sp. RM323S TaxID=3342828 RepID=UPI0036D8C437